MTYRCTATVELHADVRERAEAIPLHDRDENWYEPGAFQCVVEEGDHTYHAAYLRPGATRDTDVFLCWEPDGGQWLMDVECCLKTPTRLGSSCTIYRGHPGKCDWGYVDPPAVAAEAWTDQYLRAVGLGGGGLVEP
ncbi:hypothetical protein ACPCAE_14790 [Streptomyces cinereoruber]|uniref:hypothetical protein n=1 Tax=Streptomyces cinereoruber TaxID=67260 RepID=UPI003C2BEBF5